jgi:hypothetical protein
MEKAFQSLSLDEKENFYGEYEMKEVTFESIINNKFSVFLPVNNILDFITQDQMFSKDDLSKTEIIDIEKLSSVLKLNSKEESKESKNVIDLKSNKHIKNNSIMKALICFFGSINSKNDFTKYTSDYNSNLPLDHYINYHSSYSKYLLNNLSVIFDEFKLKDMHNFLLAVKECGINLIDNPTFFLTKEIKNQIFSKNKILLVIASSNNFWIKSEKMTLGNKNYDKRMNNYSYIFYNWPFIRKFYDKVANHPRCLVGYVCSMISKNLKPCIEAISIDIKNFTPFLMFDQGCHEEVPQQVNINSKPPKPIFKRSQEKMIASAKKFSFDINETNYLVLESEPDKGDHIKSNMIKLTLMNENFFELSREEILQLEKKYDVILNYTEKLLDTCEDDIRDYLSQNPLTY